MSPIRLCGIAEEPFSPRKILFNFEHLAAADGDSVARRSMELATTARIEKYMACRSRGITWVDTGSGVRPISGHILFNAGVDIGEGADRTGMAQVETSCFAATSRARQRVNSA